MKINTQDEYVDECPECHSPDFELDFQRIPPAPGHPGGGKWGYCHSCKRYLQVDEKDLRKPLSAL